MFAKLFVLGRPGSGKTTAFHHIEKRAKENGWSTDRVRDYEILQDMFRQHPEKFRATDHNGFDVIDFSVLDDALFEVKRLLKLRMSPTKENELIVVEFARDHYSTALEIFSPDFSQDTHILFVDADVDTCIQRIHKRIACGLAPDKHFVSDTILKGYYARDDSAYMKRLANLSTEAREKEESVGGVVQYIENVGSLNSFYDKVNDFFDEMMKQYNCTAYSNKVPILQKL